MRQGRAVILLVIRHYYYDKRDTRPAVRYCDRLMMLVWYSETEKGRSTAKSLLQLPRPVITSVNPQLVISSTGRRFFFFYRDHTILFFIHQSIPSRWDCRRSYTPIIESDWGLMFDYRNRKQGRRDARIAWNLSLTSQIGMNISLTTEPCNGANCATFFLIQIWAWFSLEILPRFRRRFSSWVVSYGRVPFFVPIHSNPVFFLPSFLSLEFISKHIHAHICLEDKNKRRRERKSEAARFQSAGRVACRFFFL